MGKGKILVIEGTDFSGKTTQYEKLISKLWSIGIDITSESFPNYKSNSSYFVKEYLGGSYGVNANSINPKAASLFYALDRFDTYMKNEWGKVYKAGGNIVLARYITSNILHQSSKYLTEKEQLEFIDWLYHIETEILGIPKEDKVIFLDVPYEFIREQKEKRLKENSGLSSAGQKRDIHEEDETHLIKAYNTAKIVAEKFNWVVIDCVREGKMRTIDDIHEDILKVALEFFEEK